MTGNADERGRTLWDCTPRTPAEIWHNIIYMYDIHCI